MKEHHKGAQEAEEEMTEIRITLADRKHPATPFCKDARALFFDALGLDWDRFAREGMTAAELRAPGQHGDLIDRLEAAAVERVALQARFGDGWRQARRDWFAFLRGNPGTTVGLTDWMARHG